MAKIRNGLLKVECIVSGKSVDFLPVFLHRKGISVYKIRKLLQDKYAVLIDYNDLHKFFAICQNMCYNKKVVKYKGILSPFIAIYKNVGLVIGAIVFAVLITLLNNVVLKVEVTGSGSVFKEETIAILSENGAKKYAKFSSLNYNELANIVLSENPSLSFVTVKKEGNKLIVNTEVSSKEPSVLGETVADLLSPVKGVVEKINVLRGTVLVNEGDLVDVNTPLVGAYHTLKSGEKSPTFVVARITVIEQTEYFYKCHTASEESVKAALSLAEFFIGGEIISKTPAVVDDGIVVKLKIRHTIYGG